MCHAILPNLKSTLKSKIYFITRNVSQCGKCSQWHVFFRIEARGQGPSDQRQHKTLQEILEI